MPALETASSAMRLHLFGDSVFRGAVTDISENPAATLAPLQSPSAIINLVLGRPFAAFAGQTLFPEKVDMAEARMRALFAEGRIRPGDAVAFLDVGPHAMDTRQHEADWLRLRRAAAGEHEVRLIMFGGFDNGARGMAHMRHEAELDGRSPNDAVCAAATAGGDFVGQTAFVDLAGALRELDARLSARCGLTPYSRDQVHLTAWGQIYLSLLILRQLPVRIPSLRRLARAVEINWAHLKARTEVHALVGLEVVAEAAGVRSSAVRRAQVVARVRREIAQARRTLLRIPDKPFRTDPEVVQLLLKAEERYAAGDAGPALELFSQAASMDPMSVTAQKGRIKAAVLLQRPEIVVQAARVVLPIDPRGSKYIGWTAQAMMQLRAEPELVAWLDDLAEQHASRRISKLMAALNEELGDPARAKVWKDRANRVLAGDPVPTS